METKILYERCGKEFLPERIVKESPIEKGDIIVMPTKYYIFEERIGDTRIPFILVDVANNGMTYIRKFFPSCLSKKVRLYTKGGMKTDEVYCSTGSAVDLYMKHDTVNEGMNALKGKTLYVRDIQKVLTKVGDGVGEVSIFKIDIL